MTDIKMASDANKPVVTPSPAPAKGTDPVKPAEHGAAPVIAPATAK